MSEKMQVIQQKLNETSLEKKSYEKKLNQKNENIHDLQDELRKVKRDKDITEKRQRTARTR